MANIVSLILAFMTLFTGIIWFLDHFKIISDFCHLKSDYFQKKHGFMCTLISITNTSILNVIHQARLIETCASIFPVLLLVFIVRSFIFEPFHIPSGSMMPTLLIGDFILVEKFAYGIKDPITQTTLIEIGHPKRGDVVVFKYPLNPRVDYIKRVIGLPGDLVSYDPINKSLTVQPECINETNCNTALSITYSNITFSNFIQIFKLTSNGEIDTKFINKPFNIVSNGIRLVQRKESLNGMKHNILTVPGQHDEIDIYYHQIGCSIAKWAVPKGKYFMMGDNRDNSADSRYWGFVPEKNLVGKATAIWMSVDNQEGKWLPSLRLNRIGTIN